MLRLRVPASTTNLGHGFDCLGMAIGLFNLVAVRERARDEPAGDAALDRMAQAVRAAAARAWGRALPELAVEVAGEVPVARGLGSSATILVGLSAACRRLAGLGADAEAVASVAAEVEGHPDNVAAASLGGATACAVVGGSLRILRFPVPPQLRAVLVIPDREVATSEARRVLPATQSRAEAVRGLQRTALILGALAQGRPEALSGLFDEAWHEAHRAGLNPTLPRYRACAARAGAIGTILSGSGSTVLAFAMEEAAAAVARALEAEAAAIPERARVLIAPFTDTGCAEA